MKLFSAGVIVACFLFPLSGNIAQAGQIEQACLSSPRKGASWRLCGCIQQVADKMLTSADQRMAAGFFSNPHKAQEVRQSDSRRHEAFWQRYTEFGSTAAAVCD